MEDYVFILMEVWTIQQIGLQVDGLTSTTNPIAISSSIWNGSNNPSNFFDGKIGDVRFEILKELKVKLIQIKIPY